MTAQKSQWVKYDRLGPLALRSNDCMVIEDTYCLKILPVKRFYFQRLFILNEAKKFKGRQTYLTIFRTVGMRAVLGKSLKSVAKEVFKMA